MWNRIEKHFHDSPVKLQIARLCIENGFTVNENGQIYSGSVEVTPSKIAKALNIDRRVITEFVRVVLSNEYLREIYTKIKPAGSLISDIASYLNFGVVEIHADPYKAGIIAEVTSLISSENIIIRQIIADDPEINPDPRLLIVTDKPMPSELLPKIRALPSVTQVSLL